MRTIFAPTPHIARAAVAAQAVVARVAVAQAVVAPVANALIQTVILDKKSLILAI